jgi:hypothetical protein
MREVSCVGSEKAMVLKSWETTFLAIAGLGSKIFVMEWAWRA